MKKEKRSISTIHEQNLQVLSKKQTRALKGGEASNNPQMRAAFEA